MPSSNSRVLRLAILALSLLCGLAGSATATIYYDMGIQGNLWKSGEWTGYVKLTNSIAPSGWRPAETFVNTTSTTLRIDQVMIALDDWSTPADLSAVVLLNPAGPAGSQITLSNPGNAFASVTFDCSDLFVAPGATSPAFYVSINPASYQGSWIQIATTVQTTAVPEPGTLTLLAVGGLALARRKRK